MLQWRRRSKSLTMTMSGRPVCRDGRFQRQEEALGDTSIKRFAL